MPRRNLDELKRPLDHVTLITTDVFDTLLLRNRMSQRSRLVAAEVQFAGFLKRQGVNLRPQVLVRARLSAEKFAYRALNIGDAPGEVRLCDVISRQLAILGLSQALVDKRVMIELAIEKRALVANGQLAMLLRRQRQAGIRVVAVSDTGLPGDKIAELIDYFHGPGLVDKIYSSADYAASKRQGALFSVVLNAEAVSASNVLHVGDDMLADCLVPAGMGIKTIHTPKSSVKRLLARADGGMTEAIRAMGEISFPSHYKIPPIADPMSFGKSVFGPIVAEFCLFLWLYCQQVSRGDEAALLFCARGGIGIREAFERFQHSLGLSLSIKRENILISRLIAARCAVVTRSPVVLDELGREFKGARFSAVARALGARSYSLPGDWQEIFDASRFFALLDAEAGRFVDEDIQAQNDLFKLHLQQIAGGVKRIVLCDTGLYGSTQKLLSAGLPDHRFETVQFARCNYKGLSEDHFPDVAGLVVEDRFYNPFKVRTVVLRYWQIVESLFEPAIASVRHLSRAADGTVIGNSGDIRHGMLDPAEGNPLLAGTLQYIDELKSGADVFGEADRAWSRLKQAITNPGQADMIVLGVGPRSVDFGRSDMVHTIVTSRQVGMRQRLMSMKSQLWREGAIAQEFPRLKPALLGAVEMAHILRGVSARLHR